MWWVTQLLLALACGVAVGDDFVRHAEVNDGTGDAGFKAFNPLHKILEGLTEANKDPTKPQTDEESEVSDKPQTLSGFSGLHNAKKRITVGDLLHALIQKAKNEREKQPTGDKDENHRVNYQNELEANSGANNYDDKKYTESKDNVFGSIGNNEKSNNSVMIINLGGIQGHELTFLNGLDPRKCFIYVVQPGGYPQLHPLNQLHLFSQSNVPKYVVLFGNGQTHLFGNSGLQYLNTMLANSVNVPHQPNVGVVHNNVPRALLPLFSVLPNLGVHVINVLPNAWTNGMLPEHSNVHNQGVPIINIYPNIGKPLSPGADILTPPYNDGMHVAPDIPDFFKPWINVINNVTESPVMKPIIITTTSVPDIGKNWMNILQRLPGMSNPDKETSKDNGDINKLLTILGIKELNIQQPDRTENTVSGGNSVTNDNRLPLKPTSPNKDNNGLSSNNDLLLALMNMVIENNKNTVKSIAEEQPKELPKGSPKNSDSTIINLLVSLINEKTSIVSKPDKKVVVDADISNEGLTEALLKLLGRKPDAMISSDKDGKEKNMELKLSELLIKLLGGHPNILLNGKETNKVTSNIEDNQAKISETDVYNILLKILREHPNIINGSKGVSGKSVMEIEDDEKLPNHILQLLGIQAGMIHKEEIIKPNINVGSQTVIPNWPVSVSNEGFLPGKVGIDPQYLALLMKTFSAVNFPNNYVQPAIGGNVKFNLPQGFGGQADVATNKAMLNYLLSHLGCVLDEQGYYGMNVMPNNKMVTTNGGAGNGLVPLNNWLQFAQMSRNGMPNLY